MYRDASPFSGLPSLAPHIYSLCLPWHGRIFFPRGALLLFPEERYYGLSQPFGPESLKPENAVYLTTEQILADYALLLTTVKAQLNATSCPVVAFGGSYGGTLTTYFRRQYPALTVGGLAASAPIGYYAHSAWPSHGVNEFTWIDIVERVFSTTEHGPACFAKLQAAVDAVAAAGATAEGREKLAARMHACSSTVLGSDPTFLLTDALETLPQEVGGDCLPSVRLARTDPAAAVLPVCARAHLGGPRRTAGLPVRHRQPASVARQPHLWCSGAVRLLR